MVVRERIRKHIQNITEFTRVFVFFLSPSDYLILKHDLAEIMDESRDSLRYYNLGTKYSSKIEHRGRQQHLPVDDVMML